ncbi:MAG: hypothetical protein AB7R89_20205 [Dehalococcoidia bacterium]
MKRANCKTIEGKQVVHLIPESDEDLAEIHRLDEAGLIDARTNFADDPDMWNRQSTQTAADSRKRRAAGQ